MIGTIEPPCGVPAHRMGRWEDVVLGIWFCPDCGEEIWVTEGVDGADWDQETASAVARAVRPGGAAVPALPEAVPDGGDAAGAHADRAPGEGIARIWHLIVERLGRVAP